MTAVDDRPRDTAEEAAAAHLLGWNLRCNRCGLYARELAAEQDRHDKAMCELTSVRFEQPIPR